ncbi:unnamed protein product, partial [Polarella glacialis]
FQFQAPPCHRSSTWGAAAGSHIIATGSHMYTHDGAEECDRTSNDDLCKAIKASLPQVLESELLPLIRSVIREELILQHRRSASDSDNNNDERVRAPGEAQEASLVASPKKDLQVSEDDPSPVLLGRGTKLQ